MKLTRIPSLPSLPSIPSLSDAEVAARLRQLVADADDGLRRVLKCGMYIEWIAASLPHGKLMGWIEANCPDIPQRTIYNWRTLSRNVCEWVGLKFATMANLGLSGDKLIELPLVDLPDQAKPYREKIDALLAQNHSAKQLFLALTIKQGRLDPSGDTLQPKVGRAQGSGGRPASPTDDIDAMLAYAKANSLRHMGHVAKHLDSSGIGWCVQPDDVLNAYASKIEREQRCLNQWLNTPPAKRDPKALRKLWSTL